MFFKPKTALPSTLQADTARCSQDRSSSSFSSHASACAATVSRFRPQAREDLLKIWHYIAADNETAATALLRRIDRATQMMADNPPAGRDRSELAPDPRSFHIGYGSRGARTRRSSATATIVATCG
jgi:plasmid stabilization system protein ParE